MSDAFFGVLAALGAMLAGDVATAPAPICSSGPVRVSTNFSGGGRHACHVADNGEVILDVLPEGTPINASPWYAFRLDASRPTRLRVTLDYGQYQHRYAPDRTHDGITWRSVPRGDVVVTEDGRRATLSLNLRRGTTFLAAQPIETPTAVHAWAHAALIPRGFEQVEYGRSVDGRALIAYRGGAGETLVVAITRQHPPETTGYMAFRAFVERIVADSPRANAFRANHRILLAPMANPDGVVRGHWRWSAGGLDLNRDWDAFTQPETRSLRDLTLHEAQNRRTIAFFDFHSTRRNIIYAPPLDADSPTIDLLPLLRERLDQSIQPQVLWTYSHSQTGNTAKRWSLEALSAPGLTIELDDEATAAASDRIGRILADALIDYSAASRNRISVPPPDQDG